MRVTRLQLGLVLLLFSCVICEASVPDQFNTVMEQNQLKTGTLTTYTLRSFNYMFFVTITLAHNQMICLWLK